MSSIALGGSFGASTSRGRGYAPAALARRTPALRTPAPKLRLTPRGRRVLMTLAAAPATPPETGASRLANPASRALP